MGDGGGGVVGVSVSVNVGVNVGVGGFHGFGVGDSVNVGVNVNVGVDTCAGYCLVGVVPITGTSVAVGSCSGARVNVCGGDVGVLVFVEVSIDGRVSVGVSVPVGTGVGVSGDIAPCFRTMTTSINRQAIIKKTTRITQYNTRLSRLSSSKSVSDTTNVIMLIITPKAEIITPTHSGVTTRLVKPSCRRASAARLGQNTKSNATPDTTNSKSDKLQRRVRSLRRPVFLPPYCFFAQ